MVKWRPERSGVVQVSMMIVLKHLIDKIYGEIIRRSQPYNTFGSDSIGIPFPLRYCQRVKSESFTLSPPARTFTITAREKHLKSEIYQHSNGYI